MRLEATSRRRLAAMDIDVWIGRDTVDAGRSETAAAESPAGGKEAATGSDRALRIRLASGRGRWLMLIDDAGAAEDQVLLDDLRGLLGVDEVRFGRWSDSAESGVASEDWRDRGIEWVLDFGGRPVDHPAVLSLPRLDELRDSGAARKALWQALRPLLSAV